MNKCFICDRGAAIVCKTGILAVDCAVCGNYEITDEARDEINHYIPHKQLITNVRKIANMSGWLRENPHSKIYQKDVENLLRIPAPDVAMWAEKLMRWIGDRIITLGMSTGWESYSPFLIGLTFSINEEEVRYLLHEYLLKGKQFVEIKKVETNGDLREAITITSKGYTYLSSLNKNSDSQIGFCAM